MNSLRIKLMFIIVIVTAVALGTVSYINYDKASGILEDQLTGTAVSNAEYNAAMVNEWLDGIVSEVKTMAAIPDIQSAEPERCRPVLKQILGNHPDYEDAFAADKQGNTYPALTESVVQTGDREYFQKSIQGEEFVIYGPVVSRVTGNQIITVAAPTYKDGSSTPTGVTGVMISLAYLQELAEGMRLNGYGYGLIQNTDMTTIAHHNDEYLGNNTILETGDDRLKHLFELMREKETGHGTYTYQGVEKIMAYAPVELTGWSVAQTADVAEIMSPLSAIRSANVSVIIVAMIVMVIAALLIAGFIAKPIVRLSKVAEAVAAGDLTHRIDARRSNDEIGVLNASFGKMVENLKTMIGDVRKNAEQLVAHSQDLAASSEEVSATIEEIASTTNEVAATSAQGAENAEAAAMESEQMRQVAEKGDQAVKETVDKISFIATSTQNMANSIQNLGEQSNKIGDIINAITNIADQTNLLALNAAIEAARAGDHGRGFAVVAEEVRKLAEQSAGAANEITGLIKEIQDSVEEAISAMKLGNKEVSEGVQVAGNAGASLQQIIEAVEKNMLMMEDITTGAKQANDGTQQLTAASEQIASTVQQVSGSAQDLANIATDLQKALARFKV